jgi:hypothetical protein
MRMVYEKFDKYTESNDAERWLYAYISTDAEWYFYFWKRHLQEVPPEYKDRCSVQSKSRRKKRNGERNLRSVSSLKRIYPLIQTRSTRVMRGWTILEQTSLSCLAGRTVCLDRRFVTISMAPMTSQPRGAEECAYIRVDMQELQSLENGLYHQSTALLHSKEILRRERGA